MSKIALKFDRRYISFIFSFRRNSRNLNLSDLSDRAAIIILSVISSGIMYARMSSYRRWLVGEKEKKKKKKEKKKKKRHGKRRFRCDRQVRGKEIACG